MTAASIPMRADRADPVSASFRMAVDARPLAGTPCGYTVYLCAVLDALRRAGIRPTLLSNAELRPIYPEADGLDVRVIARSGDLRWEQRDLPAFLAQERFDLYFAGANRGIPWRKQPGTRYLLGLLDIIPYLFFRDYFLREWKLRLRKPFMNKEAAAQLASIARADAIVTISQQSAADITRVFRRRRVEAFLIPLRGVEKRVSDAPRRQFVYVGGADLRKKVDVLLHAFARFLAAHPGYRLVLIGAGYAACEPLIDALALRDHVTVTGYVDHDTKFRIMNESQAMVYPSLYEGYGLAIAEGFQAGIPVIAGRGGSQGEIGGDGVRYVDPTAPEEIAAAMAEMLDPETRTAWIARGARQLETLTDPAVEEALVAYFRRQAALALAGRRPA